MRDGSEYKRLLVKCVCLSVIMFTAATKSEEILWWMVNDTATVDDQNIMKFLEPYPEDDDHWVGARVKVVTSDGETNYLSVEYPDFPGERSDHAWVGDMGSEWGTGNWSTQSPLDGLDRELFEEARFSVQLGYVTYDQVYDLTKFIALAESDPAIKSELTQFLYERGTIAPPDQSQWVPIFYHTYSVPEPSSALLSLIGLSMLLLKRRNNLCA